jgi:hypothetical protein
MSSSDSIKLTINLSSHPLFLFPDFDLQRTQDTILRGEIHAVISQEAIRVQGVKVLWEVGVTQRNATGGWDDPQVWGRYDGMVVKFDQLMKAGSYM